MNNDSTTIYGLVDLRSPHLFVYVGATGNLAVRTWNHKFGNTSKSLLDWRESTGAENIGIVCLVSTPHHLRETMETWVIRLMVELGHPILNKRKTGAVSRVLPQLVRDMPQSQTPKGANSTRGMAERLERAGYPIMSKSSIGRRRRGQENFEGVVGRDGKTYRVGMAKIPRRLAVIDIWMAMMEAGETPTTRTVHELVVAVGFPVSHSTVGRDVWSLELAGQTLEELRERWG